MKRTFVLLPVLLLLLTACGSVEEPSATDGPAADAGSGPAASPSAASSAPPSATGPVSVTDARGEQIELDAPASKVVGLEWGVVEMLVSLGVMPVGVADVTGYTNWVSAAPLDEGVTDVGTRGEPSIDALVALEPDLVVSTTDLPPNIIEQIEGFVPVLVVRGSDAERPVENMVESLEMIAQAVGRTDQAAALVEEFNVALEKGARRIEEAGLTGTEFTMADSWMEGSTVSIRMFTDGSLVGRVGEELGLENAWTEGGDPDYGLAQTDVEGLTALDDVKFLYYANDKDGGDAFQEGLSGNAVWESLPFVQHGDVHRLPDGIWMFGGPKSTEQFIDAAVEALTS